MLKIRIILTCVALVYMVAGLVGCEDNGSGPDGGESIGPIEITSIIARPKSPAPGDTIQVTAVIVSDSANVGIFPSVTWSASGGVFLENGETTVRWVAPDVSTLISISVRAVTSVNTASRATTVFVGESSTIIDREAGQPFLTGSGADAFMYIRTSDPTDGFEVYRYDNGTTEDAAAGGLGENLVVAPSLTASAHQLDEPPADNLLEPINVYYSDLVAGTTVKVTSDGAPPASRRKHQFTNPALSPDGNLLAMEARLTAVLTTGVDTLDVFVYDAAAQTLTDVTATHGGTRKNLIPTFSSDGNWLLFLSDRTSVNTPAQWEYFALPVNGGVVDTALTSLVQLTNTNNQVVEVSNGVASLPLKAWNPVSPVLAIVMTNNALMQITVNGSGSTTVQTPQLNPQPRELIWSPDGSVLAYSTGGAIYSVPAGGTERTLLRQAQGSDQFRDLVWSPDLQWIVYRVSRGTSAWFEIKAVGDPDAEAVVLTPATPTRELNSYRRSMSMSPVWLPTDELMLLLFPQDTPSIDILDIGAALD